MLHIVNNTQNQEKSSPPTSLLVPKIPMLIMRRHLNSKNLQTSDKKAKETIDGYFNDLEYLENLFQDILKTFPQLNLTKENIQDGSYKKLFSSITPFASSSEVIQVLELIIDVMRKIQKISPETLNKSFFDFGPEIVFDEKDTFIPLFSTLEKNFPIIRSITQNNTDVFLENQKQKSMLESKYEWEMGSWNSFKKTIIGKNLDKIPKEKMFFFMKYVSFFQIEKSNTIFHWFLSLDDKYFDIAQKSFENIIGLALDLKSVLIILKASVNSSRIIEECEYLQGIEKISLPVDIFLSLSVNQRKWYKELSQSIPNLDDDIIADRFNLLKFKNTQLKKHIFELMEIFPQKHIINERLEEILYQVEKVSPEEIETALSELKSTPLFSSDFENYLFYQNKEVVEEIFFLESYAFISQENVKKLFLKYKKEGIIFLKEVLQKFPKEKISDKVISQIFENKSYFEVLLKETTLEPLNVILTKIQGKNIKSLLQEKVNEVFPKSTHTILQEPLFQENIQEVYDIGKSLPDGLKEDFILNYPELKNENKIESLKSMLQFCFDNKIECDEFSQLLSLEKNMVLDYRKINGCVNIVSYSQILNFDNTQKVNFNHEGDQYIHDLLRNNEGNTEEAAKKISLCVNNLIQFWHPSQMTSTQNNFPKGSGSFLHTIRLFLVKLKRKEGESSQDYLYRIHDFSYRQLLGNISTEEIKDSDFACLVKTIYLQDQRGSFFEQIQKIPKIILDASAMQKLDLQKVVNYLTQCIEEEFEKLKRSLDY